MITAPLATYAPPIRALRWSAVFAGIAVGIALQVAFTAAGGALGFVLLERREGLGAPMAAAGWNVLSLLIASCVGGYVAGRASGLRRTADGMLHGTVAWAATIVALAWFATGAAGSLLGGLIAALVEARVAPSPVASAWLALATALSLLAGVLGGLLGVRGARRFVHRSLKDPALPAGAAAKRPE
jgi:hypothetical protein